MSLCWAARGGEALELSNPLSGELGITSAATCLPARSQNHRHTHSYIQKIRSYIFTDNPIYAQRRRQSAHWGFLRELPCWLVSREPQSQISVKNHWTKLTHACFDQKIMNQPQNLMAFSPINVKRDQSILKQQLEVQYNCHFKNWH